MAATSARAGSSDPSPNTPTGADTSVQGRDDSLSASCVVGCTFCPDDGVGGTDTTVGAAASAAAGRAAGGGGCDGVFATSCRSCRSRRKVPVRSPTPQCRCRGPAVSTREAAAAAPGGGGGGRRGIAGAAASPGGGGGGVTVAAISTVVLSFWVAAAAQRTLSEPAPMSTTITQGRSAPYAIAISCSVLPETQTRAIKNGGGG